MAFVLASIFSFPLFGYAKPSFTLHLGILASLCRNEGLCSLVGLLATVSNSVLVLCLHLAMGSSTWWRGNSAHTCGFITWLPEHCIGGFVDFVRGLTFFLCWLFNLLPSYYSFHHSLIFLCFISLVKLLVIGFLVNV